MSHRDHHARSVRLNSVGLLEALQQALRRRMQEFSGAGRMHGWVVFGVDGNRTTAAGHFP